MIKGRWLYGSVLILAIAGGGDFAVAKEHAAAKQELDPAVAAVVRKPLPYAEYVKLVARRGIVAHRKGRSKSRMAKNAKPARAAVVAAKVTTPAPAAKPTVITVLTPPAPVVAEQTPGWRPSPEQLREIIRSTRNLAGANLRGMNLARLDLRGVSLVGADLYHADLGGAILDRADLRGAALEMADLRGTSLQGANLAGAGLFKTNLQNANLDGADLTGVYAVCANFRGARLVNAKLWGSVFTEAVLDRPLRQEGTVVATGERKEPPALVKTAEGGGQAPVGRKGWWVRPIMF